MIGKTYIQPTTGNSVVYDFTSKQFEVVCSIAWLKEILSKNVQDSFRKMNQDIHKLFVDSLREHTPEFREHMNNNLKGFTKDTIASILIGTQDANVSKIANTFHVKFPIVMKVK